MFYKPIALVALAATTALVAGCGKPEVVKKGVVVGGYGEVKAVPDVGELRITVQSRDRDNDSSKAIEANSKKCDSVRAALTKLGVKSKEITTESFDAESVQPYVYEPHYQPKGKPYFQVTNRLLITTKDVKAIGKLIDAGIEAGVTSVDSVEYRFDDPAKLQAEALSRAVRDAKVRAEAVAKAGGIKLLPINSVVQAALRQAAPRQPAYKAEKMAATTYTAPKEETASADVVVTFAIQRP